MTHVDAATGRGPRVRRRRCRRPRPPHLPAGFNRTFKSRFIDANGIRQHAVIGGDGPPLLLLHGWPENWYAWRLLMAALARDFTVIAVDQRGIGLTVEDLVRGREDAFLGYEFRIQRGAKLPDYALRYYVKLIKCDPDALRGSFGFYRAWDATLAQNEQRTNRPLTMPVLGIGGAESWGEAAADGMRPAADDVQTLVIPGAGHWVAEQAPEEMLAALTTFLATYRDASMAAHTSRRRAAAGSGSRG